MDHLAGAEAVGHCGYEEGDETLGMMDFWWIMARTYTFSFLLKLPDFEVAKRSSTLLVRAQMTKHSQTWE